MKIHLLGSSCLAAAATVVSFAGPVHAQSVRDRAVEGTTPEATERLLRQAAQDGDIITVTATKREQTLQEVPLAVTVVDAELIENQQINTVIDLQSVVPALRVDQAQSSAATSITLRGFGSGTGNNVGIEPSVAVYVDGIYRARAGSAINDFPNLERVEVLRGPQSTLFGKNAAAGVLSILTTAPSFEWTGETEVTFGNYDQRIAKGFLSGPITDELAFSLGATINKADGFARSFGRDEIGDRDRYAIRAQALWEPSDNLSIRSIVDYDAINEICCYGAIIEAGNFTQRALTFGSDTPVEDPFSYETSLNRNPVNEISNGGLSTTLTYDFPGAELVSLSSYRFEKNLVEGDFDFLDVDILSDVGRDDRIDYFTQETRLSGSTERFDWLVGGFYYQSDIEESSNVVIGSQFREVIGSIITELTAADLDNLEVAVENRFFGGDDITLYGEGNGNFERFDQDNRFFSLFGQFDFRIIPTLTATLGIAYANDDKEVVGRVVDTEPIYNIDFLTPKGEAAIRDAVIATSGGSATERQVTAAQNLISGTFQFIPTTIDFPNAVEDGKVTSDQVTYTARLSWEPKPWFNLYGYYATGYKPVSFNISRSSAPTPVDFARLQDLGLAPGTANPGNRFSNPEDVTVYEVGLKMFMPFGFINVAAFDQTIEGVQQVGFQTTGFTFTNIEAQVTRGVEIDSAIQPTEWLSFLFNGAYYDAEYEEYTADVAPGIGSDEPLDRTGERPPNIPEYTLFGGAKIDFDLAPKVQAYVQGGYQYVSEVQASSVVPAEIATREVNQVNASAGLTFDADTSVRFWMRNVTNDQYFTLPFATPVQPESFSSFVSNPRTFGVSINRRF